MVAITSKLPHVGTTIFTVMTQRATELGAINLAQGFPDYDPPARLMALVAEHVAAGHNQYAPMPGLPALRAAIAQKFTSNYGRTLDPQNEITITLGGTEALFSSILALVHSGDEVILFDPAYDSYAPAVLLAGGRPIHIPLLPPDFSIDWQQVSAAVSPRTRMVILNNPHNPIGRVTSATELDTLARVLRTTDALVLSDEVYEHMVFDDVRHTSVAAHADLAERSVAVFSFGKTLHATGWRVGYAIAAPEITRETRRVHQFNTFTITTPIQHAIAAFLAEAPEHNAELAQFYQAKRDFFLKRLQSSRFRWVPTPGTYFQLLDFSDISSKSDVEFADTLLTGAGVASIPISPFYAAPMRSSLLRFCFAKGEATLSAAAQRLCRL